MLKDSKDVHRIFIENPENSWTLGLMAFAIFEDRRFDWMQHFEENEKRPPTPQEIEFWYTQQPDRTLIETLSDAENALAIFAEDTVKEIKNEMKRDAEKEALFIAISSLNKPWKEFGISLISGVISSCIFTAILILFAIFVLADPSPLAWVRGALQSSNHQENVNGGQGQ